MYVIIVEISEKGGGRGCEALRKGFRHKYKNTYLNLHSLRTLRETYYYQLIKRGFYVSRVCSELENNLFLCSSVYHAGDSFTRTYKLVNYI